VKQEEPPSYVESAQPMPLDDAERATVAAQLAGIEDERLRKAVARAMVADLEWKKGLATT
jgi:hypothetical protein